VTATPAITSLQLLWVNLVIVTLAAAAFVADTPVHPGLRRLAQSKSSALVSFDMWKMISGQSLLQVVTILVLHFCGPAILETWPEEKLQAVKFNAFAWFQIFNQINCRLIVSSRFNVFARIQPIFIACITISIGLQLLIVFIGGTTFSVSALSVAQWAISVSLGFLTFPIGVAVRLVPNNFVKITIPRRWLQRQRQKRAIIDEEWVTDGWNPAIDGVRDDLMFGKLRSRLANPRLIIRRLLREPLTLLEIWRKPKPRQIRQGRQRRAGVTHAAVVVPALVSTAMMWSPDPAKIYRSSAIPLTLELRDLEAIEGLELHEDTNMSDPMMGKPLL
jgi:Cation transporting ATPase, C-terminus